MRWLITSLLFVVLAAPVVAQISTSNVEVLPPKGGGDGASDGREGGETYLDAHVIGDLPYTDTGATCDNINDITPDCAYSIAPDVVYVYVPATDGMVSISLCGSSFDTILEVQEGAGVSIACNDDFCGLQSEIQFLPVTAGTTYYIIVDGYDTACGSYAITVMGPTCSLHCPSGWPLEGEPPCGEGYVDVYNSGCNGSGWGMIQPGPCVLCGRSGTYLYDGWNYRDTDWFDVIGSGETLTVSCVAEFPLQLLLIYGTDCLNPQYDIVTAGRCEEASLSRVIGEGEHAWIWVGPSAFSGVGCESVYLLQVTGLGILPGTPGACCLPDGTCSYVSVADCEAHDGFWLGYCTLCDPALCPPPTPVERVTWGAMKQRFR